MIGKCIDKMVAVLTAFGGAVLLLHVLLTAVDVSLRFFFNAPIASSYELSEIAMGIIAPVALLYCAFKNEHVCVDILYEHLPAAAQTFSRLLSNLVVMICVLLLAWQGWYQIVEVWEMGVISPMLGLPMWHVACVFLVSFVLFMPIAFRHMRKDGE